ncbi:MAG: pseudoazurin [Brevundimonas sp.]|jgi:pseudoazurin|uniref:pseudoazurin n=1 Tax=Brevundimonas sp. TaxID=1871086 RepID=UPI0017D3A23B|nr:pseudoazurin [Brevundimonas sp.]MBA4805717.1 pseudoazurin [Brevundimonas sp.]
MLRRTFLFLAAAGGALAAAGQAAAAEHRVQMLNRGPGGAMVFSPALVRARVGDTVRFVPTDPGHNAETIPGMLPPGVAVTRGAIGREFLLRVARPGVYGVKCTPHYGLGMVALVVVGDGSPNRAAAAAAGARAPGQARRRFADLFGRL